ncbi:hypothetical protein O3P69_011876 [Scylla paramamosain]|uniref:Uncharacterized protein n=1 Tax=Scylla paramamosain TaxID=85552 RepID=A0AAW0SB75_SCYPA
MSPAHVSDNLTMSGGANHLPGPSPPPMPLLPLPFTCSGRDLVPRVIRRRYVTPRRLLPLKAQTLKRTRMIRRWGVVGCAGGGGRLQLLHVYYFQNQHYNSPVSTKIRHIKNINTKHPWRACVEKEGRKDCAQFIRHPSTGEYFNVDY